MVREEFSGVCAQCSPPPPQPTDILYHIRSSLLGGQLIATTDRNGNRIMSYVYSGDSLIASRDFYWAPASQVAWRHNAPSGSTEWGTTTDFAANGGVSRKETDPVGADMGTENPYSGGGGGGGNPSGDLTSRFADATDFSKCYMDGVRTPCGMVIKLWASDVVEVARDRTTYVRFKNPDTGEVRRVPAVLTRLSDGRLGYVPVGGSLDGRAYYGVFSDGAVGRGNIKSITDWSGIASLLAGQQQKGQTGQRKLDVNEENLKKWFVDTFSDLFNKCVQERINSYINSIKDKSQRKKVLDRLKSIEPFNLDKITIDGSLTRQEVIDKYHPALKDASKTNKFDPVKPENIGATVDTARNAIIIPKEIFTDPVNWQPYITGFGDNAHPDGTNPLFYMLAHEAGNLASAYLFSGDFYALGNPNAYSYEVDR